MTDKNKIWYPEEVIKAIEDFYTGIRKGGKTEKKTEKQNNIKADFSIKNITIKNFPTMSIGITPQMSMLKLF